MSDKLPYCPYCLNATIDPELTPEDDLAYMPIGVCRKGYRMFLKTGVGKPTVILVDSPNKEYEAETRIVYEPKYCPECGRKLIENARNEHENSYTGKNQ